MRQNQMEIQWNRQELLHQKLEKETEVPGSEEEDPGQESEKGPDPGKETDPGQKIEKMRDHKDKVADRVGEKADERSLLCIGMSHLQVNIL